jgi:hypothetical protein
MKENIRFIIRCLKWGIIGISPIIVFGIIYLIGWEILKWVLCWLFIIGVVFMIGATIVVGIIDDKPND